MAENTQSTFWDSIPDNLRNAVQQAIPANILQERLSLSTEPESLQSKYTQLERTLKETINHEEQTKQSSAQQNNPAQSSNNPQPSALFPLAMLRVETKQYAAAEETYRNIVATNSSSRPDLAAMSNLIDVLNLQHKYAEAQTMAMQVLPLLQKELGVNSPQYLGCMRKLMESLVGQDKGGEARAMYQKGMDLVATISDDGVKKVEGDAMQEMDRKIDSLG
ncbi:hypothetical protein KCU92_g9798, partial [Aureobasidium melanogenum]